MNVVGGRVVAPKGERRSFADLSVNVKILTAVGLAGLVGLIVGITGLRALSESSAAAQKIYSSNLASVNAVGDIRTAMVQTRLDVVNQVASDTARAKYEDAFIADAKSFDTSMAAYLASRPAGAPAVIAVLQSQWQAYTQLARDALLPAGRRGTCSPGSRSATPGPSPSSPRW